MNDDSPTAPIDFRFPVTQQTFYCWARFNEFLLCAKQRSQQDATCMRLKRDAMSLCPTKWIDNWSEDLAEGRFVGVPYDEPIRLKFDDDDEDF